MKRVTIALLLLITVLTCCAGALFRLERAAAELTAQAQEMAGAVMEQNDIGIRQAAKALEEIWKRESALFHIITGSQNCERLEEALCQLRVWSTQKEKSPETLSELSNVILNASRLVQQQRPGLINLF